MKIAVLALSVLASAPALAQPTTQCVGTALHDPAAEPLYLTIEWGTADKGFSWEKSKQPVMIAVNGEGPYQGSFEHQGFSTRCGYEEHSQGGVPGFVDITFESKDFASCGPAVDKKTATLAVSPEGEPNVQYKLECEAKEEGGQ